jgi:hypothetical protein
LSQGGEIGCVALKWLEYMDVINRSVQAIFLVGEDAQLHPANRRRLIMAEGCPQCDQRQRRKPGRYDDHQSILPTADARVRCQKKYSVSLSRTAWRAHCRPASASQEPVAPFRLLPLPQPSAVYGLASQVHSSPLYPLRIWAAAVFEISISIRTLPFHFLRRCVH